MKTTDYAKKNADRKLQDRRSQLGKNARKHRQGCKGKFGRLSADLANEFGFGTPNWQDRDSSREKAAAKARLDEMLAAQDDDQTLAPTASKKARPQRARNKPQPTRVRFDK